MVESPNSNNTPVKQESKPRIRILNPISKVSTQRDGTIIQNLLIESASCDSMIEDYIEESNFDEHTIDDHIVQEQSSPPSKVIIKSSFKNPLMIKRRKVVEVPRIEHSYSIPKPDAESTPKVDVPKDGCEIFGRHVAFKLQGYNSYVRNMAQHLINNVLFDADMGKFDSFSNVQEEEGSQ